MASDAPFTPLMLLQRLHKFAKVGGEPVFNYESSVEQVLEAAARRSDGCGWWGTGPQPRRRHPC